MAEKNSDKDAADDGKTVTDEDLKNLKKDSEKVENSQEADETTESEESEEESEEAGENDGKTDESQDEESEEEDKTESDEDASEFVKEFPNIKGDTVEDYARELERTLQLSNTEGKRLSDRVKELETGNKGDEESEEETGPVDPIRLYMEQQVQKDITDSFNEFSKSYPQTKDSAEYDKFQAEVSTLSNYIMTTQKRVAPASELYSKVAVILGWKPEDVVDNKEKLNVALKDKASISKTTSATKPKVVSKVTDAQVSVAKQMGGWTEGKSDAEIRKELETVNT